MKQKPAGNRAPNRIASPEELHDVMRVSSPKLWIILTVIMVLLAGLVAYAATFKMENTLDIRVTVSTYSIPSAEGKQETETRRTQILGTVPLEKLSLVDVGMAVRFSGATGKVSMLLSSGDEDTATIEILPDEEPVLLPDGTYDGKLVLETVTPLSFLLN